MPATGIPVTTCDRNEDSNIRVSGYLSPDPKGQPGTPVLYVFLLGLIVLGTLGLRLYHVTYPPYDFLSWRDTQTLMIARNYYRDGMNLFAPRVDWRTLKEVASNGLVGGTELNLTPYLTALLYHVFGIEFWVGRVVPIFFSLLGVVYFFRLVQRFYGPLTAIMATVLFSVSPFHLFCGRVQMPEAFAFAMAFATLYYYDIWLASPNGRTFACAVASCALMLLGKPQMALAAIPMLFLTVQHFGWRFILRKELYLFMLLVAAPVGLFMWHSYAVIAPKSGIALTFDSMWSFGMLSTPDYWKKMASLIWSPAVGPWVCALGIVGLFIPCQGARGLFAHAWALSAVAFIVAIPGMNSANVYYQMVFAPPLCVHAARALRPFFRWKLLSPVALILLGFAVANSLAIVFPRFYEPNFDLYHCGLWLRENTDPDTLIVSADPNPACMYFADRVGWNGWDPADPRKYIETVHNLGASVLAAPDWYFDWAYFDRIPYYNRDGMRDYLYDTFDCYHSGDFAVFFLDRPADLSLPENDRIDFGTPGSWKYLRDKWARIMREERTGTGYVETGKGTPSTIKFTSARPLSRLVVVVSSAEPQEVGINLNGRDGKCAFPAAWKKCDVGLPLDGTEAPSGVYKITLTQEKTCGLLVFAVDAKPRQ
jgi:hypothetical protein